MDYFCTTSRSCVCPCAALNARYGPGMALGFLAVHLVKRIIRKIPVVGIIARPILGRLQPMHVLTDVDMTRVALRGSLTALPNLCP